jgi:LacI family transcriptional regulator
VNDAGKQDELLNQKKKHSGRRQHASVTVSDVARHAGVSPMTVSRVLNGQVNVKNSTREAVTRAIDELGYLPNKAARSLASAQQLRIGLLYSDPASTFLSAMLLGILEQARQSDTHIVVVECSPGFDTDATITKLIRGGVDGIMLAPPLCDSRRAFNILIQHDMPTVTIGSQHSEDRISSVCIDDHRASFVMTQQIISLGHRRIGFIIGTATQSSSIARLAGFRDAMQDAGIRVADERVVQGEFSYRSGYEAADQLLNLEQAPTAILASNDDMAAGAVAAANHHHLDVPADLTICGFDDTMLARSVWPTITTIRQPIAEMSSLAIDLLEGDIRRRRTVGAAQCQHRIMDFSLVRRESDAPVR